MVAQSQKFNGPISPAPATRILCSHIGFGQCRGDAVDTLLLALIS